MKAHDLAKALLASPNVPVVINGWGSDEGSTFEVTEVSPLGTCAYSGARDTKRTPRDAMGYQKPRKCLSLWHGKHTPWSDKQVRQEKAAQRKAARLKKTNPRAYAAQYASIEPITPAALEAMAATELDIKSFPMPPLSPEMMAHMQRISPGPFVRIPAEEIFGKGKGRKQ